MIDASNIEFCLRSEGKLLMYKFSPEFRSVYYFADIVKCHVVDYIVITVKTASFCLAFRALHLLRLVECVFIERKNTGCYFSFVFEFDRDGVDSAERLCVSAGHLKSIIGEESRRGTAISGFLACWRM